MLGFEVAGVILGVLPLVIDALADYREGNGVVATLLKFRGLLDSLIHQLKTQKTIFIWTSCGCFGMREYATMQTLQRRGVLPF